MPLTTMAVAMPVAKAARLCHPIIAQSVCDGTSQITGPI